MTTEPVTTVEEEAGPSLADQMCERLVGAAFGMTDLLSVYLGDRLGLYRALHDGGPATPPELAERAGVAPRYAREWLEHQAATGILEVAEPSDDGGRRRFRLPKHYEGVFVDADDLTHVIGVARVMVSLTRPLEALLEAFRTGGGVPWEAYGQDLVEGQAGMNRPLFVQLLGSEWLPAIPDVHARLLSEPPARVADIGCGAAWSGIAIARAYPLVTVDGYDIDPAGVALARQNVADAGLEERVRIIEADAAAAEADELYDLVTVFETVHDLAHPVELLAHLRELVRPGGAVIVMDENVGERFTAPAEHFLDPFFYGAGMWVCLPTSLAAPGSAATGAVMRPATFERYAREAGFAGVEVLPIEFPFYRFYRLRP